MPRPVTTLPTPTPEDPGQQAHERLDITHYPPKPSPREEAVSAPFVQQVRQQMTFLEGEIARLEAQMATMQQTYQDRRYQLQHLSACLAADAPPDVKD